VPRVNLMKLFEQFYKDNPDMCSVVDSQTIFAKFYELYFGHILANDGTKEGWASSFRRLAKNGGAITSVERADREFRSSHDWLFPTAVKNFREKQEKLWHTPEGRSEFIGDVE
jgi:hypothetical protein